MTEHTKNAVPAELARIDTAAPLRDRPAKVSKPAREAPEFTAMTIPKFLARKMAGNIAAHLIWMAIVGFFPAKKAIICLCAFVASQGGWVVKEAGAETKPPGLVARLGEKLKHPLEAAKEATAKPVEVVKEGAKKAVVKAEEKAEVLREEVKEQAGGVKEALRGLKAGDGEPAAAKAAVAASEPPESPGFIESARVQVVGARDAVASRVQQAFGGHEGPTPAEIKEIQRRRDQAVRNRLNYVRKVNRTRVQNQLGYIGAQLDANANLLATQYQANQAQRIEEGNRRVQAIADQANANIRGVR